jgi:hypothetical protein
MQHLLIVPELQIANKWGIKKKSRSKLHNSQPALVPSLY